MSTDAAASSTPPRFLLARLRAMMFLEYAVRGFWLPWAPVFLTANIDEGGLGFSEQQKSWTLGTALAIGAIASPFVAGQVADRWFATQRFMGVLLVLGGITKIVTGYQTSFEAWLGLSIVYAVLFMPTLGLSNSLAMSHLTDPKRQFPSIRVWGTIGWIAVLWLFPVLWLTSNVELQSLPPFFTGDRVPNAAGRMLDSVKVAGVVAVLYGVFSLCLLPHTPPKRGPAGFAFVGAIRVFSRGSLRVLAVATLAISIVHFVYFLQAAKFLRAIGLADAYITPAMSIGQFAEIGTMAALGLLLKRLGFRTILLTGAACYALRYLIFGLHEHLPIEVIVTSQALHGPCFACFYAGSFIYVDRLSPPDVRHSAQTLFALIAFGIGPLASSMLDGTLATTCRVSQLKDAPIDYSVYWLITGAIGLIGVGLMAAFFRDEAPADDEALEAATHLDQPEGDA